MKAVFFWELLRRKTFLLWWTVGVSALIGVTVLSYLAIKGEVSQLNQALGGITNAAGTFFGGSDLFSPVGYLSSQIYYITLPLLLIIMVTTLVSSLMAKDENDGTVELTLARSISRRQLLCAKALAGLTIIVIIAAVSYAVTAATVAVAGISINPGHLLLTHMLCFAFSVSFGVISFTLIAVSRRTRRVASIVAIVLSFGGYVVSSLAGFADGLKFLAHFIPYHYYDTTHLLVGTVSRGLVIYLVGVLVVGVVVSAIGYQRRDIG